MEENELSDYDKLCKEYYELFGDFFYSWDHPEWTHEERFSELKKCLETNTPRAICRHLRTAEELPEGYSLERANEEDIISFLHEAWPFVPYIIEHTPWRGFKVYEPSYGHISYGGLPRTPILVKDGIVRFATEKENFEMIHDPKRRKQVKIEMESDSFILIGKKDRVSEKQ